MQKLYEKIINEIKGSPQQYRCGCFNNSGDIVIPVDKVIDIIMQAVTEDDNGWIPCDKELPPQPEANPIFENKPLEIYLVTVANTKYPLRAFWNGEYFTDGWDKVKATAWQPLPETYQPKGEP